MGGVGSPRAEAGSATHATTMEGDMMQKIRVVRVLEYTYDTPEAYMRDSARWTVQFTAKDFEMKGVALPVSFEEGEESDG